MEAGVNELRGELIVLRFRDIEVDLGQTIALHKRAIAESGFCWWGWLYRGYERNPHRELERLGEALARSDGFPVALFDTGQSTVYRATCTEIRAMSRPQRSPNPAATPAYYNDRRAPAWFRLTDIVEIGPSLVIGRTCCEMPSASDECFVDLLGQVVRHLRDLRRQEVTLWVLG
jgi:hypothetical protein